MATIKRSPPHPSSSLSQSVDRARRLYQAFHEHWMPIDAVAETLGASTKSSAFLQSIATLRQFGLLYEKGSNENREFQLTPAALDLLTYEAGSKEWNAAALVAALAPTLHAELWARFEENLPPEDAAIRVYLVRQREGATFHPDQVDGFIRQLRESFEFAGLVGSATIKTEDDDNKDEFAIVPGVYVQWTSQGQDQFPSPRKVVSVDGDWVFVEETSTGVPMSELTIVEPKSSGTGGAATASPPPSNPHFRQPQVTGPRIEFPLPDDNFIEIRLKKPVAKKDFDRIKKLLELSEDSLVESDD